MEDQATDAHPALPFPALHTRIPFTPSLPTPPSRSKLPQSTFPSRSTLPSRSQLPSHSTHPSHSTLPSRSTLLHDLPPLTTYSSMSTTPTQNQAANAEADAARVGEAQTVRVIEQTTSLLYADAVLACSARRRRIFRTRCSASPRTSRMLPASTSRRTRRARTSSSRYVSSHHSLCARS